MQSATIFFLTTTKATENYWKTKYLKGDYEAKIEFPEWLIQGVGSKGVYKTIKVRGRERGIHNIF